MLSLCFQMARWRDGLGLVTLRPSWRGAKEGDRYVYPIGNDIDVKVFVPNLRGGMVLHQHWVGDGPDGEQDEAYRSYVVGQVRALAARHRQKQATGAACAGDILSFPVPAELIKDCPVAHM